ncbi:Chromodomain-helicase-DNA-binding protein 4 [Bienertia sinuspersici]
MTQNSSSQSPQSLSSAKICFNCNSDDHWILHNVGFRVESRKLCTSCVLKLHPTSFCPTCFNLHDPNSLNPPPFLSSSSSSSSNRTLTCLKCSSVSHITCVPPNAPKSPYLCPPCSNPSFKFFDFKKPRKNHDQNAQSDKNGGGGNGGSHSKVVEEQQQLLDERAAKVLLLAAKIASISMNKVVISAKADVERKVKDAALAKKRAKESIDHVMSLSSKLISVKQQRIDVGSGPGSSHGPVKLEMNGGAHNVGGSGGEGSLGNGAVLVHSNGGNSNNNMIGNNHVGKESTG